MKHILSLIINYKKMLQFILYNTLTKEVIEKENEIVSRLNKFSYDSDGIIWHKDYITLRKSKAKDKNGKVIIEGDIVTDYYTESDKFVINYGYQEILDNEMWGSNKVNGFYTECISGSDWNVGTKGHFDEMENREVIGNVFIKG